MNKKLITLILTTLLILIGKSQAVTLTQVVDDNYIYIEVDAGQQITLTFNNNSNYTFTKWTVESGSITIDTTNPNIIFTMPNSDVTIRGNYEEEQPQGTLLSDVATVGAYVTYVPSSTSYTVPTTTSGYDSEQSYTPSSTTSWRVFSVDGENIEIISTDSVGSLYLKGATGYTNAVQTLNDMSIAYVNSTYAASGRSLGYYDEKVVSNTSGTLGNDMTETEKANYKVISTSTYPLKYSASGFPYRDFQYYPDTAVLANHGSMYHSSGYVWLASRYLSAYSSMDFAIRIMDTDANRVNSLYGVYSNGTINTNYNGAGNGVRPIVSLKSGVTVTGSGTEADPYVINESNPSQYTVTYSANGGYGEMNPQSVAQGSGVTLTTNTYEHHGSYAFKGWSTSATATTATYTNGQSITPTADMTLYAVWEEIEAPTLAANLTWYKGTTSQSTITEINIVKSYTPEATPTESWNADTGNTGSIKCYIEGTKLTIAGNGASTIKANVDSSYLFSNYSSSKQFTNVTSINGLTLLDTSAVTDMSFMFDGCSSLTSVDVSNFNTSTVTDMSFILRSCSGLTSLDLSRFNTSAVTDMRWMFGGCSGLTSLDLSNFNTSAVTDMSYMFGGCSGLTSLDLSNFNTGAVTDMGTMFSECSGLTSLDLSNFNTSAVTDMVSMFVGCSGLTSLDVSSFNTSTVTEMSSMFSGCSGLTSLDLSNFNTSAVTKMSNMFNGCSGLTSLDLSNFNTSAVTNMAGMFLQSGLTSLDLSNFNTSAVTNMSSMFFKCYGLASLDLRNFNTSAVTDMSSMFLYTYKLQQITIGPNFSFTGNGSASCELPTPRSIYITGADGNWYKADGTALTPAQVAAETRTETTTYCAVKPLSATLSVGDYITYTPSSTSYIVPTTVSGYTSDQIFNPSSTTSWRVLSNDGTNVEIISADSVDSLYLQGEIGYKNAVQTLNDMSVAYVNSTYAISGRSLGYYDETRYISKTDSGSAMTETELANYKIINTSLSCYLSQDFPYKDYQYMSHNTALANHGSMYHSSGYVWLASRTVSTNGIDLLFAVRFMDSSGVIDGDALCITYDDGSAETYDRGFGVRPVISLKTGLAITGGTGTADDPYVINESNPSQYTVTYCANGGYGEMTPQSVSQGSSVTLTTNAYEHHSLSFLGWATSATATTATYTDGQTITPTADMTLYAVWAAPSIDSDGDGICDNCGVSTYSCTDCGTPICEGCKFAVCNGCGSEFCNDCLSLNSCDCGAALCTSCTYCASCETAGLDYCEYCSTYYDSDDVAYGEASCGHSLGDVTHSCGMIWCSECGDWSSL